MNIDKKETDYCSLDICALTMFRNIKAAYSVTINIFRKILFSF